MNEGTEYVDGPDPQWTFASVIPITKKFVNII